jgi:hypothetical protein
VLSIISEAVMRGRSAPREAGFWRVRRRGNVQFRPQSLAANVAWLYRTTISILPLFWAARSRPLPRRFRPLRRRWLPAIDQVKEDRSQGHKRGGRRLRATVRSSRGGTGHKQEDGRRGAGPRYVRPQEISASIQGRDLVELHPTTLFEEDSAGGGGAKGALLGDIDYAVGDCIYGQDSVFEDGDWVLALQVDDSAEVVGCA